MDILIKETSNYDLFDKNSLNRNVYKHTKKYKKLKDSMEKNGFISASPLHCFKQPSSKKIQIKGGHHRFEVAKDFRNSSKIYYFK